MPDNRPPSVGDAFRVTFASLIFAAGAQIAILLAGVVVLVVLNRGTPDEDGLYRLLLLSILPYAVIAFQTVLNAVRGIAGVMGTSTPQTATVTRQDLRMIPVWRQQTPTYNGVDVEDLIFFIKRICVTKDWRQRTWTGVKLPSGIKCEIEDHRKMVEILKQAGFIIGHRPRATGRLVCSDPEQIIEHLGIGEHVRTL